MHSPALQIADDRGQFLRFGRMIESKASQHGGPPRAEERDRAAVHARARADSGVAEHDYCTTRHVESDHVPSLAADGDYALFHQQADFISSVAVDDDCSAAHPSCRAAIGRTDLMAGVTLHADQSATHLATDPVASATFNMD